MRGSNRQRVDFRFDDAKLNTYSETDPVTGPRSCFREQFAVNFGLDRPVFDVDVTLNLLAQINVPNARSSMSVR
ncbi:MAG: hypothetical protein AB7O21_20860 [Gammaproteobacteria bacterium]